MTLAVCSFLLVPSLKNALASRGIDYIHCVEEIEIEMLASVAKVHLVDDVDSLDGCLCGYDATELITAGDGKGGRAKFSVISGLLEGPPGGKERALVAGDDGCRQLILRGFSNGKLKQMGEASRRAVSLLVKVSSTDNGGKNDVVVGGGVPELLVGKLLEKACSVLRGEEAGGDGLDGDIVSICRCSHVKLGAKLACLAAIADGLFSVPIAMHGVRNFMKMKAGGGGGLAEWGSTSGGHPQPLNFTCELISQFVETISRLARVESIVRVKGPIDRGGGKAVQWCGVTKRKGLVGGAIEESEEEEEDDDHDRNEED